MEVEDPAEIIKDSAKEEKLEEALLKIREKFGKDAIRKGNIRDQ